MISHDVDSHILYRHTPSEVAALVKATIPMADCIKAVALPHEKYKLRLMTSGQYFRVREAKQVKTMLLRACKYARANLSDYFPIMQAGVLENSQALEDAVTAYWAMLETLREESIPVH